MSAFVKIVAGDGVELAESGGVVTINVVERGSNSNGQWVRYEDGTQICVARQAPDIAISTSSSFGGFLSAAQTWTYPAEFSHNDMILSCTPEPEAAISGNAKRTSTSACEWRVRSIDSMSEATRAVHLAAIGRWK